MTTFIYFDGRACERHIVERAENHPDDRHYFASTIIGWATGKTPYTALKRVTEMSIGSGVKQTPYWLFEVPAPATEQYQIDMYEPQVPGTRRIETGELRLQEKK
jgi:hypothetical protein